MTPHIYRVTTFCLAALAVGLLVIDAVRQLQLGFADLGLALFAFAELAGVVVAVVVARQPGRERMAFVMAIWLVFSVLDDVVFDWPDSRTAATVWMLAHGLLPAVYGLMVLSYPSGRLRARGEQLLVALAALVGIVWMGGPLLSYAPGTCSTCLPHVSSLVYAGSTFDDLPTGEVSSGLFIVIGVVFVALLVRRLWTAPRGALVTLLPLWLAVVFTTAEFVTQRALWLGEWHGPSTALERVEGLTVIGMPFAILIGLAAIRRRRGPLGDLVVELGRARPGEVGDALARALGDPTLELALWLPERAAFVDEAGEPVDTSMIPEGRALTTIGPADDPLAVLIHDERLAGQQPLLEAAGSAAQLALENTRLQAELRAQLAELRASRARIVGAADAERRRVERDLHDGAQQRLLGLGLALQLLRDSNGDEGLLAQAEEELQAALRELRDLARGIHPTILSEQGLGPAVRSLADRAPIPVHVAAGDERYPSSIETTIYFVVAEALANVAKHAEACSVAVSLARENGTLLVDVSDDGRGGATARDGGGLVGLCDRVAAAGGMLTIASTHGEGTTIHVEVPCGS